MIVQRFLHWLNNAPKSSRADAAAALARARLDPAMSADERDAADAALTLLLDDPAPKVRYAIADALASHALAPRHMIIALARDQADIAMIVLCRSPVFLDSELVDIARDGDGVALTAIACRQPLSNYVASAIIKNGNYAASLALLQNNSINLDVANLHAVANMFGGHAEIREALLAEPNLPAEIRQALILELANALENLVLENSWLGKVRAKRVVREARDRATSQLAMNIAPEETAQMVEHLRKSGQLTAAFLLRTICGGNIHLFVAAIANLAGIPENRILAVLQQGRSAAFRAIYERSSLPKSAISAITAAIDAWRDEIEAGSSEDDIDVQRRVMERVVEKYGSMNTAPDQRLLALLRRILAEVTRDAALMRARAISSAA